MLRGIPLPDTGTFEARLLAEGIQRERNEKFAFAQLLTTLVASLGVPMERIRPTLIEYGEELYQFRYNSRYESAARRIEEERLKREANDLEILAKVDAMTVE